MLGGGEIGTFRMGAFQDFVGGGGAIDIRVDYYSEEHAKLLARYPEATTIRAIAGTTLSIPAAEFLTYCLFVDKRAGLVGLRNYHEIQTSLQEWMNGFNLGLAVTPTSLRTRLIGNNQIDRLTEKIGVGVALSVTNRIHGLKEADWSPIPTSNEKSLDYEYACTSTGYVQIEAKGTAIADNTRQSRFPEKAADIEAKKKAWPTDKGPVSAYGTIAVIDQRPEGVIQCWLLDPPPQPRSRWPLHQRIINRLRFAANILETLLPKSILTFQLEKRIGLIAEAEEVARFDKRPLAIGESNWKRNALASHAHDIDGRCFGEVYELNDGSRFFYGIRSEWLDAIYQQDFGALIELQWEANTTLTTLAVREDAEPGETDIAAKSLNRPERKSKKMRPEIAYLNTSSSGRVFGFLGLIEQAKIHEVTDR